MKFSVKLFQFAENNEQVYLTDDPLTLFVGPENDGLRIILRYADTEDLFKDIFFGKNSLFCGIGGKSMALKVEGERILVEFQTEMEMEKCEQYLTQFKSSPFWVRTEKESALSYFQYYGSFAHQQNMIEDWTRTNTYYTAIMANMPDFRDKVVLDVGAGSGLLSFFAVKAGALRVYAVEASNIAKYAKILVNENQLDHKICVIQNLMEDVNLPEAVDIIISEPIGYMLFNERMLETFLYAKKWLKEGGLLYPSQGELVIAPFFDSGLYWEICEKASFWGQSDFLGCINFSSIQTEARKEYFQRLIIDVFSLDICLAPPSKHSINFYERSESDLETFEIPLEFSMHKNGVVHGLAFWFDVIFKGSYETIVLSTSPSKPTTHWYQARCLIDPPMPACVGEVIRGKVLFRANACQSYHALIELTIDGSENVARNEVDLKNPYFRQHYSVQNATLNTGELIVEEAASSCANNKIITEIL